MPKYLIPKLDPTWKANGNEEDLPAPLPGDITKASLTEEDLILYHFGYSPPCGSIRAFLSYYNVKFKLQSVNMLFKTELSWSKYKLVPIMIIKDKQINDSCAIIKNLSPIVAGITLDDDDVKECKEIGRPLRVAHLKTIFTHKESHRRFVDYVIKLNKMGFIMAFLVRRLMFPYIVPKMLNRSAPEVTPQNDFIFYLKRFKDSFKDQWKTYYHGDTPGPLDLQVYGMFLISEAVCAKHHFEWLDQAGLKEWYEAMKRSCDETCKFEIE